MKRKLLSLMGFTTLLLNSCKPEIEQNIETPPNRTDQLSQLSQLPETTMHKFIIKGNATYVKEANGKYFFSDDIIISPDQFNFLKNLSLSETSIQPRSAIATSFVRTWPNGVIYYRIPDQGILSNNYYEMFKKNIDNAFNMISSKTKIKFIERTSEAEYLHFQFALLVNDSPLGYTKGQRNIINIHNVDTPAIIAHEIMHSMGIMHEQCRPDRDQHAIVDLNRVQKGNLINFNIDPTMVGFGDFDFGSVMMYGPTDFAIDPLFPVITKLDGSLFEKQRTHLSDGDYAGINHLYSSIGETNQDVYNIQSLHNITQSLTIQADSFIDFFKTTTDNNQKFVLRKSIEHGYYTIIPAEDLTKALTISGTGNLSIITAKRNKEDDDQKWLLYNLGNEGYSFAPKKALNSRIRVGTRLLANGQEATTILIYPNTINSTTRKAHAAQVFKLTKIN